MQNCLILYKYSPTLLVVFPSLSYCLLFKSDFLFKVFASSVDLSAADIGRLARTIVLPSVLQFIKF